MTPQMYVQFAIQFIGMLLTIAGVVFYTGKRTGRTDAIEQAARDRDTRTIEVLDAIERRLQAIEARTHHAEIALTELRVTLIGQSGNNGINSVVKSHESRIRDLERVP